MHRLLLIALAVVAIEAHINPLRNQCINEREELLDQDPNADLPVCTVSGNYKNRQCDDDICWCVSKRRGRPIFNKQQVPLDHPYDCKRRPKKCLKNELAALLQNPNPGWLPKCDCIGHYESKQCQEVASDECVVTRKKRQSGLTCGGTPSTYTGFNPVDRSKLDTMEGWTMVSEKAFPADGRIPSFEVYVGASGLTLRIGIYRPSGGRCHFNYIQEIEFTNLKIGYNMIPLTGSDILQAKAGDSYGFTWLGKGVIDYDDDKVTMSHYCEDQQICKVGDHINLHADRHGRREYSIRLQFDPCKEEEPDTSCSGTPSALGFPTISRDKVDKSAVWTMVSKQAFTVPGTVSSFEIFVASESARGLRVGIYRPTGTGECDFELIQQNEWTGFKSGLNTVELTGSDVYKVQKGDRYGFTWLQFGVIEYEELAKKKKTKNYCEKEARYSVGNTMSMDDVQGNRMYSILMFFNACDKGTKTCEQCFCVDKINGVEIADTRTFNTTALECD